MILNVSSWIQEYEPMLNYETFNYIFNSEEVIKLVMPTRVWTLLSSEVVGYKIVRGFINKRESHGFLITKKSWEYNQPITILIF